MGFSNIQSILVVYAIALLTAIKGLELPCHGFGIGAKAWGCCKICENFEHARLAVWCLPYLWCLPKWQFS